MVYNTSEEREALKKLLGFATGHKATEETANKYGKVIENALNVLEVFSNFEMELDKVKGISCSVYYLTIKNERDEELTLFLGGWEKDYNILKEWLKRL